ncbi:MAG TPA: tetratricopeptide repeat protein [Bryobacteraceae bacterium]
MREIRRLHQSRTELAQSKKLILDGIEFIKRARWQEAKTQLTESSKLSPQLPASYYHLGQSEATLGESTKAAEAYQKALVLAPDYAKAHMPLGILFARTGQAEAGLRELRDAVLSDPDLADAHYNLALLLMSAGNKRETLSELSAALALDPSNSGGRIVANNLVGDEKKSGRN